MFQDYNMLFASVQVQAVVCVSQVQHVVCFCPGPNINCCLCFLKYNIWFASVQVQAVVYVSKYNM